MAAVYIDSLTFGNVVHWTTWPCHSGRVYAGVADNLVILLDSWRYQREPDEFLSGLIADAMDDDECPHKDEIWHGLVRWMRDMNAGVVSREDIVRATNRSWHQYYLAAFEREAAAKKAAAKKTTSPPSPGRSGSG